MVQCDSYETRSIYPNLTATTLNNQQKFRINEINETKDYFVAEINERQSLSKMVSKHIASFHYFDKSLIVLCATSSSISIASFATVIGVHVGIASASFSLAIPISLIFNFYKNYEKIVNNNAE